MARGGALVVDPGKRRAERMPRESMSTTKLHGEDELSRQSQRIIDSTGTRNVYIT